MQTFTTGHWLIQTLIPIQQTLFKNHSITLMRGSRPPKNLDNFSAICMRKLVSPKLKANLFLPEPGPAQTYTIFLEHSYLYDII